MKNRIPYVVMLIEAGLIVLLAMGGLALVAGQYNRTLKIEQPVAERATRSFADGSSKAPVAVGETTSPSVGATPSAAPLPSPTPTPTATPDPRKMVNACGAIDAPGQYLLTADLNASGDCLKVQSSRVSLDCAGHRIQGASFKGYGITVQKFGLLGDQVPSDVQISNCRLSRFYYGIYVESGIHLVIRDNESSNNYDDVDPGSRYGRFLGMTEGGGIRLNYTTDSILQDNTTLHQAIGIDIRDSTNISVTANTSSDNSAWGINLQRTQNSRIRANVLADNVRQCTWGAGVVGLGCDAGGVILQDSSNGNLVANNQVSGKNGNGIFIKAHALPCGNNNTITGNLVTGALYNSVELGFCTGNKVNGNIFRDGLDAVWLGFAHDNEIKDNTIIDMKNHGIISGNSHNNTISGNRLVNTNVGLYFFSEDWDHTSMSWLPPGDYRSHDNCLCNNQFQGNTVSIQLKDSTNNQVTNNDLRGNVKGVVLQGKTDGNSTQGNMN